MHHLYEGMFLLDNNVVRQGWKAAKAVVTELLAKQGAKVHTARRWDERRLAYPIKGRGRATYLLIYFELAPDSGEALNRTLELNETVLRYLITRVESVPAAENELAAREEAADFVVPAPPVEEERRPAARETEPDTESGEERGKGSDEKGDESEKKGEEAGADEASAESSGSSEASDAPEKVPAGSGAGTEKPDAEGA